MLYELEEVRRFTEDLVKERGRCDNGEGMVCGSLDETIRRYAAFCRELLNVIRGWAEAVYKGEIERDPEVERLLREHASLLLHRAKQVSMIGRKMLEECFVFDNLTTLNLFVLDLDYLLANWVTPRRAVGPGARVKLSSATLQQAHERLNRL